MRGCALGVLAGLILASPAVSQDARITRALDLERRGEQAEAAKVFREILHGSPADVAALFGLERVLAPLNRSAELSGPVSAALAARPDEIPLYGIAVRAYTAARMLDSVRAAVRRWARLEPGSESPYQEWGMAALQMRDRVTARQAYAAGRAALGSPDALAGEMAQLYTLEGDYASAIPEWITALKHVPGYKSSAVAMLGQAPTERRPAVLAELGRHDGLEARRIRASLQVRWGAPIAGLRWLLERLPADRVVAIDVLQDLIEDLRLQTAASREAREAQGMALERLAGWLEGGQAARRWLEAAQAYADAGNQSDARRMLAQLAQTPGATPAVAAQAATTLVSVLIEEGKVSDADARYRELESALPVDERDRLRLRLAVGWLRAGRLGPADALLGADSSVEALAVRGRVRLYSGDVAGAVELLSAAGPFAGDREAATHRANLLAILQVVDQDSFPALGVAFFALERGDSAEAAARLESVGRSLPGDRGGGEVLLLAGRLRAAMGTAAGAETLFREAAAAGAPAAAAAAELQLAELYRRTRRQGDAVALLEHLIVTYPTSASVPSARRLLEILKGGIPGGGS